MDRFRFYFVMNPSDRLKYEDGYIELTITSTDPVSARFDALRIFRSIYPNSGLPISPEEKKEITKASSMLNEKEFADKFGSCLDLRCREIWSFSRGICKP